MDNLVIRRAVEVDLPAINRLLVQVQNALRFYEQIGMKVQKIGMEVIL